MNMERGVSLTRYEQSQVYLPNRKEAFRLRIQAHHGQLLPNEIFLHRKSATNPATGEQFDEFLTVCSPFDLTAYPADAPTEGQDPPFFRKSVCDKILDGQIQANECWLDVYEEVCLLVEACNKLDYLVERETVRCGGDTEPDTSVSESISASV
jgi:hypothetical protein